MKPTTRSRTATTPAPIPPYTPALLEGDAGALDELSPLVGDDEIDEDEPEPVAVAAPPPPEDVDELEGVEVEEEEDDDDDVEEEELAVLPLPDASGYSVVNVASTDSTPSSVTGREGVM